jgi:hypothetical protein
LSNPTSVPSNSLGCHAPHRAPSGTSPRAAHGWLSMRVATIDAGLTLNRRAVGRMPVPSSSTITILLRSARGG